MVAKSNAPAKPAAATAQKAADNELVISRIIDAPRELVWQAWTDPKMLGEWWGPQQFTNQVEQLDARPGGKWRIIMRGPEGQPHPAGGIYKEVVKPDRLVFTINHSELSDEWHDKIDPQRDKTNGRPALEGTATITFEDLGGKTKLSFRIRFESAALVKALLGVGMYEGWSQSLDRLAAITADKNAPVIIERVFHAPIAQVWQAITSKDQMKKWYFDLAEFKPEVGFEFRFDVLHKGNNYVHLCKVTEVVPPNKIAYNWRYQGEPGDSLVTWELFDEDPDTRLRLTHTGLETFPQTPDYAKHNFVRGWTGFLGTALKKFLEG